MKIITQEISSQILIDKKIKIFIKRLDLINQYISGNKWFKLKYNFTDAKNTGANLILTFGGAYSNHIAATSLFAKLKGFNSIGIIRGEEHLPHNPTLKFAIANGMKIFYVSRGDYRLKSSPKFIKKLNCKFGSFYMIPEGGTNKLAITGASEILDAFDDHDYVCCSVGTGGTISGIINSVLDHQKVLGFPAIKSSLNLKKDIEFWTSKNNYEIIENNFSKGYAKISPELVNFINNFYNEHKIPLDGIYTGKMFFKLFDLISNDYFPRNSTILAIHSGGLQGNFGLNERFSLSLPTH